MQQTPCSCPRWMSVVLCLAGVYNLVCGTIIVCFPLWPFALARMTPPNYPAIVQCLAMVIGVYGMGYLIAAQDPVRHWAVVLVGLLGKVFGPIGFVWATARGEFPWHAGWMILANDLVWWFPFLGILLYALKAGAVPPNELGSFRQELERAKTSTGESLWDLSQHQKILLVFVRHAGCTFCREAVADVGQHFAALQTAHVKPVIVHMGTAEEGRALSKWSRRDDLEMISDPDRRLFRAFELKQGTLWQLAGPYVMWRALFGSPLYRYGFGKMIGDPLQLAGMFLIEQGQIRDGYRCKTTADRLDICGIALRGA